MKTLNLILKIFFIRIVKKEEKVIDNREIISYDLTVGGICERGYGNVKINTYYFIEFFINPLNNKSIGKFKTYKIN